MGEERTQDLQARVLAWHHRHPLARRIDAAQLESIGWVALPFAVKTGRPDSREAAPEASAKAPSKAPGKTTAKAPGEVALPKRSPRDWEPAFSETVIDGLSVRRLARFALRHGIEARPPAGAGPVREVTPDAADAKSAPIVKLWLQTVLVETGASSSRLLLGPASGSPVLGRRLWSRPRTALGSGLAVAVLVVLGTLAFLPGPGALDGASAQPMPQAGPPPQPAPALARTPPPAAIATPSADAGRVMDAAPPMETPTNLAAPRVAEAPAAAPAAASEAQDEESAAPPPAPALAPPRARPAREPSRPLTNLLERPSLQPQIDASAKAMARAAVASARAARDGQRAAAGPPARINAPPEGGVPVAALPASAPVIAPTQPVPALAVSAQAAPAQAVPAQAVPVAVQPLLPAVAAPVVAVASAPSESSARAPVWGVSTPALRTRFESEQMLLALRDAARRGRPDTLASLRFEVLPMGADWRAVSWPFAQRGDAERLRTELQARGVRVDVVAF